MHMQGDHRLTAGHGSISPVHWKLNYGMDACQIFLNEVVLMSTVNGDAFRTLEYPHEPLC